MDADDQTWMLAGEVEESAPGGQALGTRIAVIVRDGSPQQVAIWAEEAPLAADCGAFASDIPTDAVEGPAAITPVKEGGISLPAALDG